MWKQKPDSVPSPMLVPPSEPVRSPAAAPAGNFAQRPTSADKSTIARGVIVRGDITGTDPLYVDGTVEGSIHIGSAPVTIGPNGRVIGTKDHVAPCITAGEIVIMGSVTGNIEAIDRVDLRAHATLAGDVSTARVSIEDGAYFRGGIDIRREAKPPAAAASSQPSPQQVRSADTVAV